MSAARPQTQHTTQLVEYLKVYLSEDEFKKIESDKVAREPADKILLTIYNKELEVYSLQKKSYDLAYADFLIKQSEYEFALIAYNEKRILTEPVPPIKPIAPKYPTAPDSLKLDPRIASRNAIKKVMSGEIGQLSRVFNAFSFEYKVADKMISALNVELIQHYILLFIDIATKGKFEVVHLNNDTSLLKVDAISQERIKQLAVDIAFLGCEELLDESGQLHSEIMKLLMLNEVEKKWKADNKAELISNIIPQVLISYCTQFVAGAISVLGTKSTQIKNLNQEIWGLLLLYFQRQLCIMDKDNQSIPTSYFLEQIDIYRFYRTFVMDLEKIPSEQLKKIIEADVIQVNQNTSLKTLTDEVRRSFWQKMLAYLHRNFECTTKTSELITVITSALAPNSLSTATKEPFNASYLGSWLRARDNTWLLENLLLYASEKDPHISEDLSKIIKELRHNEVKMHLPIQDLLREIDKKCSDLKSILMTYTSDIKPVIDQHDSVKHEKVATASGAPKPFISGSIVRWKSLPQRLVLPAQLKVFPDDSKGEIVKYLRDEVKKLQQESTTTSGIGLFLKENMKEYLYLVSADSKSCPPEIKSAAIVKSELLASLIYSIDEELKKSKPQLLSKMIDDWKSRRCASYSADEKGVNVQKTNYDVISLRTGFIKILAPKAQCIIDEAIKKFQMAVHLKKPKG